MIAGDRNLKNGTVHCKRRGKLVEMKTEAMVALAWRTWPRWTSEAHEKFQIISEETKGEFLFRLGKLYAATTRIEFITFDFAFPFASDLTVA